MKYLPANSILKIPVDIKIDGEFTYPSGPVQSTLTIGNGLAVEQTLPAIEATQLEIDITTPEVISGSLDYLTLVISCDTPLGWFRKSNHFAIFNYNDLFTDADKVRELLGLTEFEYKDSDFDLEGTYFKVLKLFNAQFNIDRTINPLLNKTFGDLIAVVEALRIAPTMLIKLADKEETENGKFDRWGDPKYLGTLIDSLTNQYYDLKLELTAYLLIDPSANLSLLVPTLVPMLHQATGDTT